jgi:hypothetical protein
MILIPCPSPAGTELVYKRLRLCCRLGTEIVGPPAPAVLPKVVVLGLGDMWSDAERSKILLPTYKPTAKRA